MTRAEDECKAANVDENDYTVFTCQDLEFELELLEQSITKKIAFIDNQVRTLSLYASYMSLKDAWADRVAEHDEPDTSTARAIREHVPIFRQGRNEHAQPARDGGCARQPRHCVFRAYRHLVLLLPVSLMSRQDEDMDIIYDQLLQDYGAITFEAFINLLVRHAALCWLSRKADVVICRSRLPRTKRRRNSCVKRSGEIGRAHV